MNINIRCHNKRIVIQTRGLQFRHHRKYNELLSITVGVKRPLPWGKLPPRGRLALGRGASCPTHGASCPFGNASFKLVLYKNVYTHSSWNWHMCSTNRALSWHKNIECSSKVCDQEVHQTLKGGVLPHPTLYQHAHAFYFNPRHGIEIIADVTALDGRTGKTVLSQR